MLLGVVSAIGLFLTFCALYLKSDNRQLDNSAEGLEADIIRQALRLAKLHAGVSVKTLNSYTISGTRWTAYAVFEGPIVTIVSNRVHELTEWNRRIDLSSPDAMPGLSKIINDARLCGMGLW